MEKKFNGIWNRSELIVAAFEMARRTQFEFSVHYYRGFTCFELGIFEEAAAEFMKAVRLEPLDFPSRVKSGISYYRLGKDHFEKAAKQLEEVIKVRSFDQIPYPKFREIYAAVGGSKEALPTTKGDAEYATNDMYNPWALYRTGYDCIKQGELKSVMEWVRYLSKVDKSGAWELLKDLRVAEERTVLKDEMKCISRWYC